MSPWLEKETKIEKPNSLNDYLLQLLIKNDSKAV